MSINCKMSMKYKLSCLIPAAELSGKVVRYPSREEIDGGIQEHLIVELYSR